MILTETNEEIDFLIKKLESLVIELRKNITKYPNRKFLKEILKRAATLYKNSIIRWMEQYPMNNVEPDKNKDEELKNKILDMANQIIKGLKK